MICSCQNMTLCIMLVLKLHEVSLYIFISGLISTIILHVLFSSLFFPADEFSVFFLLHTHLHSYLTLSVRQLFYFSIYIYLVSVFVFDFPYCGCNLFLPHLILVFSCVPLLVTVTLLSDDTQLIYIYIIVTYANMLFCILLPFISIKLLLRPFPDIFSYVIPLMIGK